MRRLFLICVSIDGNAATTGRTAVWIGGRSEALLNHWSNDFHGFHLIFVYQLLLCHVVAVAKLFYARSSMTSSYAMIEIFDIIPTERQVGICGGVL